MTVLSEQSLFQRPPTVALRLRGRVVAAAVDIAAADANNIVERADVDSRVAGIHESDGHGADSLHVVSAEVRWCFSYHLD